MRKITKAVFPVAGLGTRFLPATKASPKEMLPIVDKPLIQYAVEEAAAAGITDMIFITGRNKRAIEDHFDKAYELETELALRNKTELLEQVQAATPRGHQLHLHPADRSARARPRGAVRRAGRRRRAVRGAARRRPDRRRGAGDAADDRRRRARGLLGDRRDERAGGGHRQLRHRRDRPDGDRRIAPITRIVEKPKPGTTPSTLAVVGRYVLTPRIFHHLRADRPRRRRRDPADRRHCARCSPRSACSPMRSKGRRYDCGSKLGYLEATVDFGLKHPELADDFAAFLQASGEPRAPMTLNELRYIVAVAHERSFGRAAQRCFVSQPALSVAIQKLEEELGARLFERGKSEVTVTPVGERIVEQAQKVLEEAARVKEIAQAGRNQLAGPLRLGVIYTVAPYLLPDLIPGAARARAADAARDRGEPDREPRGGAQERSDRRGDHRAAVRAARHRHRIPVRGAVPRSSCRAATSGRSASRSRRTSSPTEHPILLDVGHCFRDQVLDACPELNRAESHGDAHELARDGAQHGRVGPRRVGAAARRADAQVPQPTRRAGAVRAARARRAASRSPGGRAFRARRRSRRSATPLRLPVAPFDEMSV